MSNIRFNARHGITVGTTQVDVIDHLGNFNNFAALRSISTNAITIGALQEAPVLKTSNIGSAKIPAGTFAQRDVSPVQGAIRFNTETYQIEVWTGVEWWNNFGATGGSADTVFIENGQTVRTSYTLQANKNAMSAGPIVINTGKEVTVPAGAYWTIV